MKPARASRCDRNFFESFIGAINATVLLNYVFHYRHKTEVILFDRCKNYGDVRNSIVAIFGDVYDEACKRTNRFEKG